MPIPRYVRKFRAFIGHEVLVMAGVLCVVIDGDGKVLVERRSDNGEWCLPGGILEPEEEVAPGAEREVLEETGVEVVADYLIGVYSGQEDRLMVYPNQDKIMFTEFVIACRPVGGEVRVNDDECLEVGFYSMAALPTLHRHEVAAIEQALRSDPRTHFRPGSGKGSRLMGMSDYVRNLRDKVGHELLFMSAVSGLVLNADNEILLQRRADTGLWAIPGGAIDPGEEPADAVIREVWEETGVTVIPERIVSVESGPDYFVRYPNGDEAMILAIAFACKPVSGEPHVHDEESLEVRYFPLDALPELSERYRQRIALMLRNDPRTHFYRSQEEL